MSDDDISTGGRQEHTEGTDDGANPLAENTLETATPEKGNNLANDPAADPLWNPSLEPHEPGSN
ncbi:MAG: hypothetical protein JWO93_1115 [Micrococcaceae bacterium]|jgi:hypothetical protein|nr:hypothetical protein [Micrococcaceae bacterium]